jgi:hypothetical protein
MSTGIINRGVHPPRSRRDSSWEILFTENGRRFTPLAQESAATSVVTADHLDYVDPIVAIGGFVSHFFSTRRRSR